MIYLSLNLSRLIVQGSEKKLKPIILRWFDKTSIVSREDYLAMEEQRDYFQKKHNEERNERLKLQRELDEEIESRTIDGGTIEESEGPGDAKASLSFSPKTKIDLEYFSDWGEEQKSDFKELIGLINSRLSVEDIDKRIFSRSIKEFKSLNLIKFPPQSKYATHYYEFTEFGKQVRDFFVRNLA